MSEPTVIVTSRGDGLEVAVPAVGGWGGVEKLVSYLVAHFGATCVECIEGPDARVSTVLLDGARLRVEFEDPWGCSIVAEEQSGAAALRPVVDDLRRRLTGHGP